MGNYLLGGATGLTSPNGDNINYQAITTSAQSIFALVGTATTPDTTFNPVLKICRTINIQAAVAVGDAAEQATAGEFISKGVAANQVQSVGVMGVALNAGTTINLPISPDSCGVYGIGQISGAGVGNGIGVFASGQALAPSSLASGAQINVKNQTGADHTYNNAGFSGTVGIWLVANGNALHGCGLQLANPQGQQFDRGIAFSQQTGATRVDATCGTTLGNTTVTDTSIVAGDVGRTVTGTNIPANAVVTSVTPGVQFVYTAPSGATSSATGTVSLTLKQQGPTRNVDMQSSSFALQSMLITGWHPLGSISVQQGSGCVTIGAINGPTFNTTLFELLSTSGTLDPMGALGSTTANTATILIRNSVGNSRIFASGAANSILTGTAQGDTGIGQITSGKFFHIGGTTSVIKVGGANTLGFFNVTAVGQQTMGAATAGATYTANEQAMIQAVYNAVRNIGIGT